MKPFKGKALNIYKKMQYHETMRRKHNEKRKAYRSKLVRMFGSVDLVKKILKMYGDKHKNDCKYEDLPRGNWHWIED